MTLARTISTVVSICVMIVWVSSRSLAQQAPPPVLHPTSYRSPSGEFALHVDPSTMYGQDEASYRLTRGDQQIWAAKHPFTLWEAIVTDDGTVAGYAYDHGPQGFPSKVKRDQIDRDDWAGKFHIAIFAPDGSPRLIDTVKRESSRFLHDSPNPLVTRMFTDASRRHVIVCLRNPDINAGGETWRTFDLATGKHSADAEITSRGALKAVPVFDTPLVLVQYWHYEWNVSKHPGARFALLDISDPAKPREVWQLLLAEDYAAEEKQDEYATDRLRDRIWRDGAILRCDQPRQFDLHFVKDKQRVTFNVAPSSNAGDWTVTEIARQPYTFPDRARPNVVATADLPTVHLKSMGIVKLSETKSPSTQPVRDVLSFDQDDRGRIGFLRRNGETADDSYYSVQLLRAEGKTVLLDNFRPADELGSMTHWKPTITWLVKDRWLVTESELGNEKTARAWFIDVAEDGKAARATKVDSFDAPEVESIASTGDGGFVVLGLHRYKYTMNHELLRYDSTGKRVWMITDDRGEREELRSADDIAFHPTDGGSIAVLASRQVAIIKLGDASLQRTIQLKELFGQDPNYPTHVEFERDGGLLIHDFQGSPVIWRFAPDGSLKAKFDPQFADGRAAAVHFVRVTPDGRVWLCDHDRITRLNDEGTADLTLGESPDAIAQSDIGAITTDSAGNLYVLGSRGGAVSVFDASNKPLRTMRAEPSDFASDTDMKRLTVAGNGDVYIGAWSGSYLRFDRNGQRVDWEPVKIDSVSEDWTFIPGTDKRWAKCYESVWLIDENGKPVREIARRPDGNWIVHPETIGVAPDGSLAVVSSDGMMRGRRGSGSGSFVSFYRVDGEPIRAVELPMRGMPSSIAFDSRRAVVALSGELLIIDAQDGSVRRLSTQRNAATATTQRSARKDAYDQAIFSPDGRELWLVDFNRKSRAIERFQFAE